MGSLYFLVLAVFGILHTGKCFILDDISGFLHIGGSKPLTSAAPIIDAVAHISCPQHITRTNNLMFNKYSKHCFQINVDKKADWYTAKMDCESQGGYLATIKLWSDDSFIGFRSHGALGYHSDENFLWIGLSDEGAEGIFKWVTGEVVLSYMYNSWDKNEPRQGDSINCVAYNNDNDKWSVQNCTGSLSWICQFDPVKPTSASSRPSPMFNNTTAESITTTTIPTSSSTKGYTITSTPTANTIEATFTNITPITLDTVRSASIPITTSENFNQTNSSPATFATKTTTFMSTGIINGECPSCHNEKNLTQCAVNTEICRGSEACYLRFKKGGATAGCYRDINECYRESHQSDRVCCYRPIPFHSHPNVTCTYCCDISKQNCFGTLLGLFTYEQS